MDRDVNQALARIAAAAANEKLKSPAAIQKTKAVRHASGGGELRRAKCTADAGLDPTIAATLYNSDGTTGDAITVYCNISNATALNVASPRLEIGDDIFVTQSVYDNAGTPETRYYCVTNFMATEECTCGT